MGGNQIVGGNSSRVHQRVTIIRRALIGRASSALGDDVEIDVVARGAIARSVLVSSVTALLEAVEETPPVRDVVGDGVVVVLDGTVLVHVADALLSAVLAGEFPGAIGVLVLLSVSVREAAEVHDRGHILDGLVDLGG